MKLVPGNVRRTVAVRLLLAWVALSVLAGAATAAFELGRINRTVFGLALEESRRFTQHVREVGPEHADALRVQAAAFLKGRFIALRLYDERQNRILEALKEGLAGAGVPGHVHGLAPGELDHHHMSWSGGRLRMQVLLPLAEGPRTFGYFDGVYEVEPATVSELKAGLAGSLGLTLGIVLVTAAVLYSVIAALNRSLVGLSSDLLHSNLELMEVLGSAIALRDSATDTHNYRVTAYAIAMGKALDLPGRELRSLIAGAFLHDAGKIGLSDAILLKRGPLTVEEREAMRRHVSLGVGVVAGAAWLRGARDVVEFHHEKFDGTGYLRGLAGEAIPLAARVFAVIDVFDALTSRRPYKEPLAFDEAMFILEQGRGTHFDPGVLDVFRGVAAETYGKIAGVADSELRRALRQEVARQFGMAQAALEEQPGEQI